MEKGGRRKVLCRTERKAGKAENLSFSKTKDLCEVILKANVIMRGRVRERRMHGSVSGLAA